MQYFKDDAGQPWAYEDYVTPDEMRAGLVPMTPEEVKAHLNPVKSLDELAKLAQSQADSQYQAHMQAVAEGYPTYERESWPVQLQEARDVQVNPDAPTPWLDACAYQRGMEKAELVARVLSKDAEYRKVSGFLTGVRQWHEDCIKLLLSEGESAREDLENYNSLQGWEMVKDNTNGSI